MMMMMSACIGLQLCNWKINRTYKRKMQSSEVPKIRHEVQTHTPEINVRRQWLYNSGLPPFFSVVGCKPAASRNIW
jgi:hypothetical protein